MKYKIATIVLSIVLAIIIVFSTVNAIASSGFQVGDTNGDGDINLLDVVHLAQYVAGWDVELGSNSSDMNNSSSTTNASSSLPTSSNDGWTGDYITK